MKLRIFLVAPSALLTDHLPHGDGLVAFGFIRELAARGHELHVAALRTDLRADLPANLHLHRLALGAPSRLLTRLDYMRRVRALYGTLELGQAFDIVHQLNPVEVGVSLALVGVPVPLVLGPYWPDWPGSSRSRVKRVLRAAQQRQSSTILLSSPAATSKLSAAAARRVRVAELPPGIDDRRFSPGRGGAGHDILFLANLEVRKGVHVAIEAFARITTELPRARLLLGGMGSEADAVHRRVGALPAPERVSILGKVEHERVRATMQACDLYCLPSYGEPFGMTALEAMACARPVVATDAGGLRHLVSERGGRRVPPGDSEALASALHELLVDAELRRSMGEHNRRVVEERYSWTRVGDRLEEHYREAVASRRLS